MAQKRFDEYFAKVVLESCFPERFTDLQISDKPDLRSGDEVGIEVTNCMPARVAEAFNLWHRVEKERENTSPRILERLEQLDEVQLVGNSLVWDQGQYYTDDIEKSPIKNILRAAENKIERLNSASANYANMESYELFINSSVDISTFKQVYAILNSFIELNNKPKKFNYIHLITINQKLLTFDLVSKIVLPKYLYTHLERMADKAIQLYKGVGL